MALFRLRAVEACGEPAMSAEGLWVSLSKLDVFGSCGEHGSEFICG